MPPRWLCVVIVLGWLGTTGPLLWKEVRPLFLARQPPPYFVDLLDEAQGERHPITWKVYIGAKEPSDRVLGHTARSWVKYHPQDDTISFHTELTTSSVSKAAPLRFGPITLRKMASVERVDKEELRLRSFEFDLEFDIEILVKIAKATAKGTGTVADGFLTGEFTMQVPGLSTFEPFPIPQTKLPNNGAIMLPLHLVNRIRGLRPGQTWDQPMLDPVASLLNAASGTNKAEIQYVEARVLPETQELPGNPRIVCHVIAYDSETRPRVYVQVGTDLVVRQESEYQGQRIVIQRADLNTDR